MTTFTKTRLIIYTLTMPALLATMGCEDENAGDCFDCDDFLYNCTETTQTLYQADAGAEAMAMSGNDVIALFGNEHTVPAHYPDTVTDTTLSITVANHGQEIRVYDRVEADCIPWMEVGVTITAQTEDNVFQETFEGTLSIAQDELPQAKVPFDPFNLQGTFNVRDYIDPDKVSSIEGHLTAKPTADGALNGKFSIQYAITDTDTVTVGSFSPLIFP